MIFTTKIPMIQCMLMNVVVFCQIVLLVFLLNFDLLSFSRTDVMRVRFCKTKNFDETLKVMDNFVTKCTDYGLLIVDGVCSQQRVTDPGAGNIQKRQTGMSKLVGALKRSSEINPKLKF